MLGRAATPVVGPAQRQPSVFDTHHGDGVTNTADSADALLADRMTNPQLRTDYFEIYSAHVGDNFGISVSIPLKYASEGDESYPLLYATDGNTNGPLMEAGRVRLTGFDAVRPVQQYIQVNIGYTAEQAPRHLILRNRDLIPPGEGMPDFFPSHVRRRFGPDAPESAVEAHIAQYMNSRADNFLAFIEDELHREICRRYRVRGDEVGLFGYSSGGLFSLYALTSGSRLFSRVGASSPGIHVLDSTIFSRYEELVAKGNDVDRDTHLHVTLGSHELLGPVRLYRLMGINLVRVLDMIDESPLPGLRVTSEIIAGEGHNSGVYDAYRSFIRSCYGRP
jgi:uncharacterized protein